MIRIALIAVFVAGGPWLSGLLAQETQAPPAPIVVAQFLGFSESQATRFGQLLQTLQAAIAPLEQQMVARQQRIEKLLNTDPPDPTAVGTLLVEIHALQKQAERAIQNYHDGFTALLNMEQQEKTRAVTQAGQLFPAIRAFAEVRLIEPPH